MKRKIILLLSIITIIIVLIISLTGIIREDGGKHFQVNSIRNEKIELYGGEGIYKYDSLEKAYVGRAFDWMNLCFALPIFITGIVFYLKKRVNGKILLMAGFFHFFYNYFLGVMGLAYNQLFLAYVFLYSIGLIGLFVMLSEDDIKQVGDLIANKSFRIPLSIFLIILALVFLFIWLKLALVSLFSGQISGYLETYTTIETQALDLGIFVPATLIGAVLFLKKNFWGSYISIIITFAAMKTFASLAISEIIIFLNTGRSIDPKALIFALILVVFVIIILYQLRNDNQIELNQS